MIWILVNFILVVLYLVVDVSVCLRMSKKNLNFNYRLNSIISIAFYVVVLLENTIFTILNPALPQTREFDLMLVFYITSVVYLAFIIFMNIAMRHISVLKNQAKQDQKQNEDK